MPVLHVRQVAKCLGFMPQGAAGVTSAPKDLHDSAVWVLGCSVSSPEGWGERTEGGRDGSIFISFGHQCCGERRNRTDEMSEDLTNPGQASCKEETLTPSPLLYKSARSGRLAIVH